MPAPRIGVTTRNTHSDFYEIPVISSPKSYLQALSNAGALPVLIPLGLPDSQLQEYLDLVDGVVFTGGGDIETSRFGGEEHDKVYDVDAERDALELQLVHDAVEAEKPILGICRGLQVINVAYGGTLYTHIADQLEGAVEHSYFPGHPWEKIAHPVQVQEGTRLAEIVDTPILNVNSLHHQGVKDLAPNLKATGYAPDGLVEALELEDYPYGLAVQWHPEWLQNDPSMRAIFASFVAAARDGKA
jgi:putative glutamine amidotransferase